MELAQTKAIGALGRVVIPDNMRQALGLKVGDRIHIRTDRGRIVIEKDKRNEKR